MRILLFICLFGMTSTGFSQLHHPSCNKWEFISKQENFIPPKDKAPGINVLHQTLNLEVDPAVLYITGEVQTKFLVTADVLPTIVFDCSDTLTVNEVSYHGNSIPFVRPGNNELRIILPLALSSGNYDSVSVSYEGRPYSTGLGSFQVGFHSADLDPVMWTLSQPYGAKDWWPCKQQLNDKVDSVDIIVTSPLNTKTASLGLLVEEDSTASTRTMHWQHRYPVATYLIAFATTNYTVFVDDVITSKNDTVRMEHYVYPENEQQWRDGIWATELCMEFFSDKFGQYPFINEKYGHAEFSRGGGMEHQTMSFMSSPFPGLVGHELAHQWCGDLVTCHDWREIWLNEGFATYFAALVDDAYFPESFRYFLENTIPAVTVLDNGSVYVDNENWVPRVFDGRLSYQKGAMLLHMLRWKVGDEDFFTSLRNYFDDPELRFAFSSTAQLQAHFEAVSGQDLTTFFDQWLYGQGHPIYKLNVFQRGAKVGLSLHQETTHTSVPFFDIPVEIGLYGEGQDTLVTIFPSKSPEGKGIEVNFKIDSAKIDPRMWLVSETDTVTIKNEPEILMLYPNPTEGSFQINSSSEIQAISILDFAGKLIKQINTQGYLVNLSTENLSSGTYLVRIETETNVETRKIVVP